MAGTGVSNGRSGLVAGLRAERTGKWTGGGDRRCYRSAAISRGNSPAALARLSHLKAKV